MSVSTLIDPLPKSWCKINVDTLTVNNFNVVNETVNNLTVNNNARILGNLILGNNGVVNPLSTNSLDIYDSEGMSIKINSYYGYNVYYDGNWKSLEAGYSAVMKVSGTGDLFFLVSTVAVPSANSIILWDTPLALNKNGKNINNADVIIKQSSDSSNQNSTNRLDVYGDVSLAKDSNILSFNSYYDGTNYRAITTGRSAFIELITGDLFISLSNGSTNANSIINSTEYLYLTNTGILSIPQQPYAAFYGATNNIPNSGLNTAVITPTAVGVNFSSITNINGVTTLALAGNYLITWDLTYPVNNTGNRFGGLIITNGTLPIASDLASITVPGIATNNTFLNGSISIHLNANSTVTFNTWQNSGSNPLALSAGSITFTKLS